MKVVIVDDMISVQNMLQRILEEFEEIESIVSFSKALSAFEYIKNNKVDFMFLDIEMPELSGIAFIGYLEQLTNPPYVAFITGYHEYSIDAWKTRAIGYVLKPFNKDDISLVMEKYNSLKPLSEKSDRAIEIKCFPGFDLIKDNNPIGFRSKKAKEILAYLVHNEGQWVNVNTLCYIIIGDIDESKAQNRMRSYLSRLRRELKEFELLDLIEQGYGKCRVNTQLFTCDYYRFLKGEHLLFNGEYMAEYSWAESFKIEMMNKLKKM